ncbi:hypothetical protein EDC24_2836 [Aquisalibacillus elongatus]|uniref:Uncharacterized protein n=2 Tax=Aquisalibacillus elongatus TaxID=485577 RepID=A0A3N5BL33_9BACI|nr:hypothetical protein EDC24_2836 [Aquisalibacillus elongatus]
MYIRKTTIFIVIIVGVVITMVWYLVQNAQEYDDSGEPNGNQEAVTFVDNFYNSSNEVENIKVEDRVHAASEYGNLMIYKLFAVNNNNETINIVTVEHEDTDNFIYLRRDDHEPSNVLNIDNYEELERFFNISNIEVFDD